MKTQNSIISGIVTSTLLLSVPLAAGSYNPPIEVSIGKVDLSSRTAHAKELLGRGYRKSTARLHESNRHLSQTILKRVQARLPRAEKAKAGTLTRTIVSESRRRGLDPIFVLAVIDTESSFNPHTRGRFGELGLMQLKPETAQWIADKEGWKFEGDKSLFDPNVNVRLGIAYMDWLRNRFKSVPLKYVSAYNMGPQNVRRLLASNVEPFEYKKRVMDHYVGIYNELKPTVIHVQKGSLTKHGAVIAKKSTISAKMRVAEAGQTGAL